MLYTDPLLCVAFSAYALKKIEAEDGGEKQTTPHPHAAPRGLYWPVVSQRKKKYIPLTVAEPKSTDELGQSLLS